ncbi:MAG: LacI family DNA-binding transcriptional regulator [Devosia sp.]|jgi:LacI family transcriptional regulator
MIEAPGSAEQTRPPTIVDVARAAGVAIGTVSRYLNGQTVRSGNRDQIEEAIGRLGYQRNAFAAAMKTDLTGIVGFMAPSLSEFHSGILEHLSRKMRAVGRAVLCYCHDDDPRSVQEGLDFFATHRVDSLVMDGEPEAADRVRGLVQHGTPVVLYDNDLPGLAVDRVFVENRAAANRAVGHLLDIGHTRVAVLAGNQKNFTGRERLKGYFEALAERGVPINLDYVVESNWKEGGAHAAMRRLLALDEPPTAIFCCNYNMTVGALDLIKEYKLSVPHDLSVVSFDDVPLFRLYEGGITAVTQPVEQIAETILGMLLNRLNNRTSHALSATVTLDCDIVLRGSTRRWTGDTGKAAAQ